MNSSQIRVLLVDDDEDDYFLTRGMLSEVERGHFELDWVSSYGEGLKEIRRREHDVYLIDYRIGQHNGLDLIRAAKSSGCRAPMIMLTGQGDYEVDLQAMKAGAADYMDKGHIGSVILERSIRYALQRQQASQEN
jgi:DNA-binding NtrC family response regulator